MPEGWTDDGPEQNDDRVLLELGLDELGPPACDVVRLRAFENLSFDDIGARMSMPTNTVKTLFYRGLRRLESIVRRLEGG